MLLVLYPGQVFISGGVGELTGANPLTRVNYGLRVPMHNIIGELCKYQNHTQSTAFQVSCGA